MNRIWGSIASTSGARGYTLLTQLVLLSLTARWLGPEGRGVFAASTTWATLFATVGFLSLGQVAIHLAAGQKSLAWLPRTFGSLLVIGGVVTLLGWIVAFGLYSGTGGALFGDLPRLALVAAFAALPFLVWEQYGSSLLMAVNRLGIYNVAQYVGRTAAVILLVLLVAVLGWGVAGAIVAVLVGQAIAGAWGAQTLLDISGGRVVVDRGTIKDLLVGGLRLHLNAVGTVVFYSAGILVVQYYQGPVQTGWYQLALQLMSAVIVIPQAASMVLYQEVAQQGPNDAWEATKAVLRATVIGMVGVGLIAAFVAPWAIPLIAGPGFTEAVPVFRILLIGVVGQTLSVVLAPQWIGRGLFWQVSALTILTGSLNLAATLFVVPRYGMYGAAWTFVGTYVLSVFVNGGMAVYWEIMTRRSRTWIEVVA